MTSKPETNFFKYYVPSVNEICQTLKIVNDIVGKQWLSIELEKIDSRKPPKDSFVPTYLDYEARFHPLANLIYKSRKCLKQWQKTSRSIPSVEIIRLYTLGDNINTLTNAKSQGIEEKLKDLCSTDFKLFEKSSHELQIAAFFAKLGYPVEFRKTRSNQSLKTPDLLINNVLEVECKMKDGFSVREKKNWESCKYLAELLCAFAKKKGFNNLGITVFAKSTFSNNSVTAIMDMVEKHFNNTSSNSYTDEKEEIRAQVCRLEISGDLTFDKVNRMKADLSNDNDYSFLQTNFDDSKRLLAIFALIFKCATRSNLIKAALGTVKDASSQFSRKKAALVSINLTAFSKQIKEQGDEMCKAIEQYITRVKYISGVLLNIEILTGSEEVSTYFSPARFILNKNATFPILREIQKSFSDTLINQDSS